MLNPDDEIRRIQAEMDRTAYEVAEKGMRGNVAQQFSFGLTEMQMDELSASWPMGRVDASFMH